jgi:ubiquinone/menaquinone biosynthesis C-methylase UbiE
MSDFSSIAPKYKQTATLQKSAAEQLFDLLRISKADDVLDLGCGTGHLTAQLRQLTAGKVAGIDPAAGMIDVARREAAGDVEFLVGTAEALDMPGQFDAIFCNSAFQWFRDPGRAVARCHATLRPGGRMAIQAPARARYCPNFVEAVAALRLDPRTRDTFSRFHSPWCFLETAEEYAAVFQRAGFAVVSSEIEAVQQRCAPGKAFEMFESGAAAGYLNPRCYAGAWPAGYLAAAREIIAGQFEAQAASDGQLELIFFRIYLLARKPQGPKPAI